MSVPEPGHWPASVRGLHWLGVALLLAVAVIGLVMVDLQKGSELRKLCYGLHKSLGITVLGLGLLRLAVRALTRAPAALPGPAWQLRVARMSHALMYLLLLAAPLSGWLLNSAAGQPLPWFGLFQLPALAAKSPELRSAMDTLHVWLFWSLVSVIAVHVLAALHHHFAAGDATLRRMLGRARD